MFGLGKLNGKEGAPKPPGEEGVPNVGWGIPNFGCGCDCGDWGIPNCDGCCGDWGIPNCDGCCSGWGLDCGVPNICGCEGVNPDVDVLEAVGLVGPELVGVDVTLAVEGANEKPGPT